MIRSFFLAAAMNLVPAAPLDILRFLRVPAIVWVLRRNAERRRPRRLMRRRPAPAPGWAARRRPDSRRDGGAPQ